MCAPPSMQNIILLGDTATVAGAVHRTARSEPRGEGARALSSVLRRRLKVFTDYEASRSLGKCPCAGARPCQEHPARSAERRRCTGRAESCTARCGWNLELGEVRCGREGAFPPRLTQRRPHSTFAPGDVCRARGLAAAPAVLLALAATLATSTPPSAGLRRGVSGGFVVHECSLGVTSLPTVTPALIATTPSTSRLPALALPLATATAAATAATLGSFACLRRIGRS